MNIFRDLSENCNAFYMILSTYAHAGIKASL